LKIRAVGFVRRVVTMGLVLDSMSGQVELSGGVFKIESGKGKGTTSRAPWLQG
jgi:signal transduction histidine kinase